MSDTTAIPAEDPSTTARVDAHLQRWRTETQKRRNAWSAKEAEFIADQRRRRERTMVFAGAATFGFVATLGTALFVANQMGTSTGTIGTEPERVFTVEPSTPAVSSPDAAVHAPVLRSAPSVPEATPPAASVPVETTAVVNTPVETNAPVASVATPKASEPVVAALSPTELGATSVTSWTKGGTLWIQVDTVPGRELRWLDARGNEALERTPCEYALSDGGMRCYIGRTSTRIDTALAEGAAPGSWSAQLCEGARCATVATYDVTN